MNTKIFDYLNIYASTPNPQYAIMLRGKWGCGKTHFIKGWLNKFEVKDFADDADFFDLFGQIHTDFFANVCGSPYRGQKPKGLAESAYATELRLFVAWRKTLWHMMLYKASNH